MENDTQKTYLNNEIPQARMELGNGRDEMNFAEFPLAAISDRIPDDQKTLVFEDSIYDSGKDEMITRRLTISASDLYGLPTALDDEVIFGLIQLAKKNRFVDRKMTFTRYQLIQELRWRHEGRSYERLEKSLKRWLGVTLYYEKAWWDKDEQSWVDENFHILEQVTLYDQERRLKRLRSDHSELPLSSFTWNEVVFRSFQSGYLKTIDLDDYHRLESAVAKRMYRFLDKRFYHKSRWEFDLMEFACEHIGLSRNYDTGQLKRRLNPAIAELEAVGFLEPLSPAGRYVKIGRGKWQVVFTRQAAPKLDAPSEEDATLIKRLSERGVTPSVAAELVRDYPNELIEMQVEVLDRLRQNKNRISIRNPAGYLVKSIRDGYLPPGNMSSNTSSTKASPKQVIAPTPSHDPDEQRVEEFLSTLDPQQLNELEEMALKHAEPHLVDGYERSKESGGATFAVYRQMLREREAKRRLLEKTEPVKSAA